MSEPLDITMAATKLLDENIQPVLETHDQEVQLVNSAAEMLRHRAPIEDMDDEASNFVTWLGSLHKDIMLYGLQRIFKPTPLSVVYEDKAKARIDTMQEQIDNTTGYVAANFETIDHHPWPMVHLDGTTQEDRVRDFLQDELHRNPPVMPTSDMILNGIGWDEDMTFSSRYALGTVICYDLKNYFDKIDVKKPSQLAVDIFHEKMNNYLGWAVRQPLEIGTFTGRTILAIFRMKFDPTKTPNWDNYSDMYQDLILGP